jgi:hypothetical protein
MTHWFAQSRNGYTGVDEYEGDALVRGPVFVSRTKKDGRKVAGLLNQAYHKGFEAGQDNQDETDK